MGMTQEQYEAQLAALREQHVAALAKLVEADGKMAAAYNAYADRYVTMINAEEPQLHKYSEAIIAFS
jgi:hypothetical protein